MNFISFFIWQNHNKVKDFMKNLTTTTWAACLQNPTAFISKLFRGDAVNHANVFCNITSFQETPFGCCVLNFAKQPWDVKQSP